MRRCSTVVASVSILCACSTQTPAPAPKPEAKRAPEDSSNQQPTVPATSATTPNPPKPAAAKDSTVGRPKEEREFGLGGLLNRGKPPKDSIIPNDSIIWTPPSGVFGGIGGIGGMLGGRNTR